MNVMNLCLNIDQGKFHLSWLEVTDAPTLDKNRDIDFVWFLLKIITFISVITGIIGQGGLCREGDFWNIKN